MKSSDVLKGLRCCATDQGGCSECPYFQRVETGAGDDCLSLLKLDAYNLLRELVPHLLHIDEVLSGGVCWFDGRPGVYPAVVRPSLYEGYVEVRGLGTGIDILPKARYGETWRCWNAKPDKAEQGET